MSNLELRALPDALLYDLSESPKSIRDQIIETAARECAEKGLPPPRWHYDELRCAWQLVSP